MTVQVTYKDVVDAKDRINGLAVVTPLLNSALLDEMTGARVLLKAENLQRVGAFKFRGALNRLSMISEQQRKPGVVACSSGNHAQGIAEAARILGMPASIVMPADAPALKIARTKRSGATVIPYDRETEDREEIAKSISEQTGAVFVHPFDDAGIIAGQGTLGVELVEQARELGLEPDLLLAPASGGGMIAGVALALEELAPDCEIIPVEPEGFDDYSHSLKQRRRVSNTRLSGSICDALMAPEPGNLSWEVMQRRAKRGIVVSDEDVLEAMAFAFHELKIVLEPGGAIGLAAILKSNDRFEGRCVAIVLSGGNVDPAMMARALAQSS